MDFHTLARRDLQALCKRNKIPANMTNVAMADALKALETVEGIGEFLSSIGSEAVQSSTESPEKTMEMSSRTVPRTGGRTTTRRKVIREEPESAVTLTKTRRATRRTAAAGDVEEPKDNLTKMEVQFKESEEETKVQSMKSYPATPAAPSARRRVAEATATTTTTRRISTRQSARLSEKKITEPNLKEKERSGAIKIASFAKEAVEEETSDDLHKTGDAKKFDELVTSLGENFEKSVGIKDEVPEQKESDDSIGHNSHLDIGNSMLSDNVEDREEDLVVSEVAAPEVFIGEKADNVEEPEEDLVVPEVAAPEVFIGEKTDNVEDPEEDLVAAPEVFIGKKADHVDEELVEPQPSAKSDDHLVSEADSESKDWQAVNFTVSDIIVSEVAAPEVFIDKKADDAAIDSEFQGMEMNTAVADVVKSADKVADDDDTSIDSEFQDMEMNTAAADAVKSADKVVDDDDTSTDSEFQDMEVNTDADADADAVKSADKVVDGDDDTSIDSEIHGMEMNTSDKVVDEESSDFATDDDSDTEENMSSDNDVPVVENFGAPEENQTQFSDAGDAPLIGDDVSVEENMNMDMAAADQIPAPKTPMGFDQIKSDFGTKIQKVVTFVLDDKENSCRKLEPTVGGGGEMKKKKKNNNGDDEENQVDVMLNEKSLRQLTKMLKEQLQISNKSNCNEENKDVVIAAAGAKMAKARPALQTLSENCMAMGKEN